MDARQSSGMAEPTARSVDTDSDDSSDSEFSSSNESESEDSSSWEDGSSSSGDELYSIHSTPDLSAAATSRKRARRDDVQCDTANAGFTAGGFKQETIEYVIASVQDVWLDKSEEKLAALFAYLKSQGVKSEADVETIDPAVLGQLIGREATGIILEHLMKRKTEEEHGRKNKNLDSERGPEGARNDKSVVLCGESGGPGTSLQPVMEEPKNMTDMMKMFMAMQVKEAEKNREMMLAEAERNRQMITTLQAGMQQTIENVTHKIMSEMSTMNDKLTAQIGLQQNLLDKMGGRIVDMEKRHQEMATRTQEWMEETQKMNNEVIQELVHRVNSALLAKEDSEDEEDSEEKSKCTIL